MLTRCSIHPAVALSLALAACNASSVSVTPEPTAPPAPSAPPARPAISNSAPPVASATPGGAAPRAATMSPAEAKALLARADRCLADPACTDDVDALYRRADDAGAPGVSCFRFYYGIGITKDLPRARACFERQVQAGPACDKSSPDLDRLYLASMLVDAQGGPADATRAQALFTDCFADASVQSVLEEVPKRSQPDPARAPLDFCADIGGTTLSMGQCHGVEQDRVAAERGRVDRLLFPRLDAEGKMLAVAARAAWSAFASKEGDVRGDTYRGGSLQSNAAVRHENELQKQRAEAMAHFFDYKPSAGADLQKAERDLETAYQAASSRDAQRGKLCAAARKAWTAYRDAEVALYVHVHGAGPAAKDVARDVRTRLTRSYQVELENVIKP